jgi:cytochrome c-type biogenesis protein CcmH/NrfF
VVKGRWLALALALGLAAVPAAVAAAEEGATPPARAGEEGFGHALARELMSPFCPGRALSDCPSAEAASLRAWILVQAAAGRSREDVLAELLERYGEQILAAPRPRGFGLTAYAIPIGAFLGGGALVALFLRRQTRESGAASRPRAAPLPAELERLVDQELER